MANGKVVIITMKEDEKGVVTVKTSISPALRYGDCGKNLKTQLSIMLTALDEYRVTEVN